MKKITFILFALITGTTFAQVTQNAATATTTAPVNAEIVSPIKIANVNPLDFGRIIGNTAGGTVSIAASAAGTRTALVNTDLLAGTGNTPSAASFDITAASGYSYSVDLSASTANLSGTGDNMPISFNHNLLAAANPGGGATATVLYVGGDLTVNGGQLEGAYTGEVSVTVTYE